LTSTLELGTTAPDDAEREARNRKRIDAEEESWALRLWVDYCSILYP